MQKYLTPGQVGATCIKTAILLGILTATGIITREAATTGAITCAFVIVRAYWKAAGNAIRIQEGLDSLKDGAE